MSYYLAIVGTEDNPIYTQEFGTFRQGGDGSSRFSPEMKELAPFILHAAIDMVEQTASKTNQLYLRTVDNFYSHLVSAFITAGDIKIMLLHETRNEESIRQFFQEVHDLYVKTLLSPFYFVNQPISSPVFDQRIKSLAKKYL